jgi:hypothetical protein
VTAVEKFVVREKVPPQPVLSICYYPPEGLGYFSNLFTHYKFLSRCHTSYRHAYEDGTDSVFRNVGI